MSLPIASNTCQLFSPAAPDFLSSEFTNVSYHYEPEKQILTIDTNSLAVPCSLVSTPTSTKEDIQVKATKRQRKSKKLIQYSESLHLPFGFVPSPRDQTRPFCLLCSRTYTNGWMNCDRMRSHLMDRHPNDAAKELPYFQALKDAFVKKNEPSTNKPKYLLDQSRISDLARAWIGEDYPNFNFVGFLVGSKAITANVFCNQSSLLAGYPFVEATLMEALNLKNRSLISWNFPEGSYLLMGSPNIRAEVATITGPSNCILVAQDIILNVLGRCCAVATEAQRIKQALSSFGWNGQLCGSENYTPGFELVEQYGLMVGSGVQQKGFFLFTASALAAAVANTNLSKIDIIKRASKTIGFQTKIKVECESTEESLPIVRSGLVDIIVLKPDSHVDDHLIELLKVIQLAQDIKTLSPTTLVELAIRDGNELLTNLTKLNAVPQVIDIISVNSLSQGYSFVDFSIHFS